MNAAVGAAFKSSKKYIVVRVIGCVFFIPLVAVQLFIAYAVVSSKLEHYNSLAYNVRNGNYARAEAILKKGVSPDCTNESNKLAENGEQTLLSKLCEESGFYTSWGDKVDDETTAEELAMM